MLQIDAKIPKGVSSPRDSMSEAGTDKIVVGLKALATDGDYVGAVDAPGAGHVVIVANRR